MVQRVGHDQRSGRVRDRMTDYEPRPLSFGEMVSPSGDGGASGGVILVLESTDHCGTSRTDKRLPLCLCSNYQDTGGLCLVQVRGIIQVEAAGLSDELVDRPGRWTVLPHTGTNASSVPTFGRTEPAR